jgi:hypothetical protein
VTADTHMEHKVGGKAEKMFSIMFFSETDIRARTL